MRFRFRPLRMWTTPEAVEPLRGVGEYSTGCPQWRPHQTTVTLGAGVMKVFWKIARRVTRCRSALGALADAGGEFFDVIEDLATLGHLPANLAVGIHHRGVVAAESLADLG